MTTVLCFDDGPTDLTERILDVLKAKNRKAVFGLVGEKIEGREDVVRRIAAEGHGIANHTMSHARLTDLNDSEVVGEIDACSEALQGVLGWKPRAFRPPFTACDDRVESIARDAGHEVIIRQSSIGDYLFDNPDELAHACRSFTGFIGLHELPQTLAALPAILDTHPA